MIGVYFSGTGNTKYCVETFVASIDKNATCVSIEDGKVISLLKSEQEIVLGYPVYFSNIPFFVRDFINTNTNLFSGKRIFIVATMGLFSGDGTGCSARLLKKQGATILGGLHVKMPDCIGDSSLLKKSITDNQKLINSASEKLTTESRKFRNNEFSQDGLGFFHILLGYLGNAFGFLIKQKRTRKNQTSTTKNVFAVASVLPYALLTTYPWRAPHLNKETIVLCVIAVLAFAQHKLLPFLETRYLSKDISKNIPKV